MFFSSENQHVQGMVPTSTDHVKLLMPETAADNQDLKWHLVSVLVYHYNDQKSEQRPKSQVMMFRYKCIIKTRYHNLYKEVW